MQVIGGGAANAARYDVSNNDDWLRRSFDLLGDPRGEVGDLVGEESGSCQNETTQGTRIERSLYTCETATRVTESSQECRSIYVPVFDTDYVYSCRQGTEWRSESRTCEPERVVVVDEDYVYACETGTVWTHTPASCTRRRVVVVDEDYSYACRTGDVWTHSPASCQRRRVVVVDEDYQYGCVQTWNGTTHAPNAACTANGQPGCAPSGGRTCTAPSGLPSSYVCQQGYQGGYTEHRCSIYDNTQVTWYHKWAITAMDLDGFGTAPQSHWSMHFPGCVISEYKSEWSSFGKGANFVVDCGNGGPLPSKFVDAPELGEGYKQYRDKWNGYAYNYTLTAQPRGTATEHGGNVSSCGQYAGDASCSQQQQVCVEPGGYRTINGAQVYRECWRYEVTYQCGARSDFPGCAPPTGMVLDGERCIATGSGGSCTATERTYIDPSGGCARYEQGFRCEDQVPGAGTPDQILRDVVSDTWDNGCNALQGNGACVLQGQVVLEGEQTRTINGLPVTRNPWTVREDYICSSRSTVNSCSPFTGCSELSSVCASQDRSGQCTAWDRVYRCENAVPGAGTPVDTPRDVVSDTWQNDCQALAGNGACTKVGETVTRGNETRDINGLPVTRNPWEVREDYICSSSSTVNGCSPFAGCTLQAEECSSRDRAGNCTAYHRTYRCENPANNGGTPLETPREVVSEYWTDPCATNRNDPACRMTANEVLIGEQTRTINGLSVTRNPWRRRETWTCDRSSAVNTCAPLAGCQQTGQVCGGYAPNGSCSVYDNVYRCEVETPPAGTPTGEITDHVGGEMEPQACEARTDGACRLTNSECTQPGGTRNVNGVPTTADCWEQTDTYTCEGLGPTESSCNPPSGCELKEEVCLDEVPADQCRAWENVYQCSREVVTEETRNSCQTRVCIGDMCVGTEDEGSDEMPDALAALLAARLAGEDYSKDLTIFKGQPMRCRKAIFGFRNCCKDSGWGVELGLTQCSEEEKTLMQRQEAKATHYVGTYCSQKSFFGVCIEKAMRYCAFEGTIARIVQEAGRPQVNKSWGTPKEADCSGFTIEEFQQLDLTNVDFSDFADEMMSRFTTPDPNSTMGRIQTSIESLMGAGSPGFGETNEAGGGGE
ncbi:conjugal transfer protein TraN [Phenylobacterium sp.]|uniref:conjugal transfer protein TraN n=1 Tax=Phenylobacterium sp. TaxID=1871053 RepID=UPI002811634C|nr:conjugal transfer protein TraN [Phenylobacterium sp.]